MLQNRHTAGFAHCTNIRRLRQMRDWRAVPGVGLTEMHVRHRLVDEVLVVVSPSYRPGHKRETSLHPTNWIQLPPWALRQDQGKTPTWR